MRSPEPQIALSNGADKLNERGTSKTKNDGVKKLFARNKIGRAGD